MAVNDLQLRIELEWTRRVLSFLLFLHVVILCLIFAWVVSMSKTAGIIVTFAIALLVMIGAVITNYRQRKPMGELFTSSLLPDSHTTWSGNI